MAMEMTDERHQQSCESENYYVPDNDLLNRTRDRTFVLWLVAGLSCMGIGACHGRRHKPCLDERIMTPSDVEFDM